MPDLLQNKISLGDIFKVGALLIPLVGLFFRVQYLESEIDRIEGRFDRKIERIEAVVTGENYDELIHSLETDIVRIECRTDPTGC